MNQYNIVLAVLFSLLGVSKSDITGGTYQKNKFGKGFRKTIIKNKGPKMCVKECLQANGCTAVNFDKDNLKCELLFDEGTSPATTDKEGYMYTDIHHWLMPVNPCWPTNPCKKLQKCVPTNQNGGFTCVPIAVKKCDDGWREFDGHCYLFKPTQKTDFASAKDACRNDGGYLVEINNAEEYEWLRAQFEQEGYGRGWVGLQYSYQANTWVLPSTGEPASYLKWAPGYPFYPGPEYSLITHIRNNDGLWYNDSNGPFEYACEK